MPQSVRPAMLWLAVLLSAQCYFAEAPPGEGAKDEPATEEQLKKLEEMRYVLVCKSCEDMFEAAEKEMEKKIRPGMKSSVREIVAIEIVERACKNETFHADDILRCENAVDKLDEDDELTMYIKKGVKKDKKKDDMCKPMCKWKGDIQSQISGMQESMIDKVRNEELEKRKKQMRQDMVDKYNNMTFLDKLVQEAEYLWEDIGDWWLTILLCSVGTFFLMVFVQVWCLVRTERAKLLAARRKELEKKGQ
eukprot:TRINITY_DN682_c0_g4_i1.p2 TRINITY_DN682_c0_g4~~TRINITY_DN682_c0_g4_i1.p2  ORF type:complete len:249 (+),score=108.61 TRINITY_DN682_c0_g4_i1:73-819(+)